MKFESLYRKGIHYSEALSLQKSFAESLKTSPASGRLFYFESLPVITFGVQVNEENKKNHLFVSKDTLENLQIDTMFVDRGGGATFHGPGHLVGFPVFDLEKTCGNARAVREYVRKLETVMVKTLDDFGIKAFLKDGLPGVWTDNGKIGFIGIRVKNGISLHGFGLNVSNDLGVFNYFMPCNIKNCHVTSMKNLGCNTTIENVINAFDKNFNEVLNKNV